jgi:flagellar motor switch/type III secretory pathway protein FliN
MRIEELDNKEWRQAQDRSKLIELLATCLSQSTIKPQIKFVENLPSKESLKWLVFDSTLGRIAIAVSDCQFRSQQIVSMLELLRSTYDRSFVIDSDIFSPETFQDFEASNLLLEWPQNSMQIIFVCSRNMSEYNLDFTSKFGQSNLTHRIFLDLYLLLQVDRICGDFCLIPELFFSSRTESVFCNPALLKNVRKFQYLLSENILIYQGQTTMKELSELKMNLKLGSLEISLDQFMRLREGSTFKFALPATTAVELEIGANTFAHGVLTKMTDSNLCVQISRIIGPAESI